MTDIASEVEDSKLRLNFKDPTSPVLIEDAADKNSYYVIMPMKIWFLFKIRFFFIFSAIIVDNK